MDKTTTKKSLVIEAHYPIGDKTLTVKLGELNHIAVQSPLVADLNNSGTGYASLLSSWNMTDVKVFADTLVSIANQIKGLISSHEILSSALKDADNELEKIRAENVSTAFRQFKPAVIAPR